MGRGNNSKLTLFNVSTKARYTLKKSRHGARAAAGLTLCK